MTESFYQNIFLFQSNTDFVFEQKNIWNGHLLEHVHIKISNEHALSIKIKPISQSEHLCDFYEDWRKWPSCYDYQIWFDLDNIGKENDIFTSNSEFLWKSISIIKKLLQSYLICFCYTMYLKCSKSKWTEQSKLRYEDICFKISCTLCTELLWYLDCK